MWKRNQNGHPVCPVFLCSSNKEFVPNWKVAKLSLKFQRDHVSDVWKKKISQWSHHHTGLWLGSKAQDASGVSHLRSDLIPGKGCELLHLCKIFKTMLPLPLFVELYNEYALFSWLLLDIVYFPKETHKVKSRMCSHGSVTNTLSSW